MLYEAPAHIAEMVKVIREFIREELYPLERIYIPRGFKGAEEALEPKRQMVKEMGLWAPHMPKEYGGLGLSLTEFAHISEELGRSVFGHYVFNSHAPDIGNMELLLAHGSDEQKSKYLGPLIAGEIRSCFSMTEVDMPGLNSMGIKLFIFDRDGGINQTLWYLIYLYRNAILIIIKVVKHLIVSVNNLGAKAGPTHRLTRIGQIASILNKIKNKSADTNKQANHAKNNQPLSQLKPIQLTFLFFIQST